MLSSHHLFHAQWAKQNQKIPLYNTKELTLIHAHSPRNHLCAEELCGNQGKAGFLRLLSNGNCNCSCCCSLWPNFCLLQTPQCHCLTSGSAQPQTHHLSASSNSFPNYFILLLQGISVLKHRSPLMHCAFCSHGSSETTAIACVQHLPKPGNISRFCCRGKRAPG